MPIKRKLSHRVLGAIGKAVDHFRAPWDEKRTFRKYREGKE